MSILVICIVCLVGAIASTAWLRRRIRQQRSGRRNADFDSSSEIGRQQPSSADLSSALHDSEARPKPEEPAGNPAVLLNNVSENEAVGFAENQGLITPGQLALKPEHLRVQPVATAEGEEPTETVGLSDVRQADLNRVENAGRSLEGTSPDVGESQCTFDQESANSGGAELATAAETLLASASDSKGVGGNLHSDITEPQVPSSIETGGTAATGQAQTQVVDGLGAGMALAKASLIDLEPRKFRPRPRTQRTRSTERERQSTVRSRDVAIERALPVELQLLTQLGGAYRLSLVLRKRHAMPDQLVVQSRESKFHLTAMGRKWYQSLSPANVGKLLFDGIYWTSADTRFSGQWSLPGRQLYVLSPREELDLSGFVSTNRLTIGDEHVVLCLEAIAPSVREILVDACEMQPKKVVGQGIPEGWVAYTHIVPTKSLPVGTAADILDALRPTPELQIKFRGGIRIQRSVWLSGYPPEIKIVGDTTQTRSMSIDGQSVSVANGRVLLNGNWDTPGTHVVAIDGKTRSYSIAEATECWENWVPYSFSIFDRGGVRSTRRTICGALVSSGELTDVKQFFVPTANPILIGAIPGQIEHCVIRNDIRTDLCPVASGFDPVWAVPTDALHANKATARIHMVGTNFRPPSELTRRSGQFSRQVLRWCIAVLDSSRKGLAIEPPTEATSRLWKDYKKAAKRLWRARR